MFWSLSLHLMPDETILEDSTKQVVAGLKPTYSVFLSGKRALFRFDGLGSSMTQSFLYSEITGAQAAQRMFINYLALRTSRKEYFLHIPEPAYWAARILDLKQNSEPPAADAQTAADPCLMIRRKQRELSDMLEALQKHNILTEEEVERKKKLVEALKL